MVIYMMYLDQVEDFTPKLMDAIISSVKESPKYHEIKLFFLHEYFNVLTIEQLNQVVNIYQHVLSPKDLKNHPVINQYNTTKVSLLIYRLCNRVSEKRIFSLAN